LKEDPDLQLPGETELINLDQETRENMDKNGKLNIDSLLNSKL